MQSIIEAYTDPDYTLCPASRDLEMGKMDKSHLKQVSIFCSPLTFHYLFIRQDAVRDKKYLKQVSIFCSPLTFRYICCNQVGFI